MLAVDGRLHAALQSLHSHADPLDPVLAQHANMLGRERFGRAFDGVDLAGAVALDAREDFAEHQVEQLGGQRRGRAAATVELRQSCARLDPREFAQKRRA